MSVVDAKVVHRQPPVKLRPAEVDPCMYCVLHVTRPPRQRHHVIAGRRRLRIRVSLRADSPPLGKTSGRILSSVSVGGRSRRGRAGGGDAPHLDPPTAALTAFVRRVVVVVHRSAVVLSASGVHSCHWQSHRTEKPVVAPFPATTISFTKDFGERNRWFVSVPPYMQKITEGRERDYESKVVKFLYISWKQLR